MSTSWDIYGQAPLHVAIAGGGRSNNPLDADFPQKTTGNEVLQMIIDRGANPNQQTYFRPAVRGGGGRGTTPVPGGSGHRQHGPDQAADRQGCQCEALHL